MGMQMKEKILNWVVFPGIVFCFAFFAVALLVGLVETILMNTSTIRLNLFEQITTPGAYLFGYACAALALNFESIPSRW